MDKNLLHPFGCLSVVQPLGFLWNHLNLQVGAYPWVYFGIRAIALAVDIFDKAGD
jgi:hypothetical protein